MKNTYIFILYILKFKLISIKLANIYNLLTEHIFS